MTIWMVLLRNGVSVSEISEAKPCDYRISAEHTAIQFKARFTWVTESPTHCGFGIGEVLLGAVPSERFDGPFKQGLDSITVTQWQQFSQIGEYAPCRRMSELDVRQEPKPPARVLSSDL